LKELIKNIATFISRNIANTILKPLNIFIIYRFGKAIGDQVCMSAAVKALKKQKGYKVIVFSSYPEIFYNNPNVYKNVDIRNYPNFLKKMISRLLDISKGGQIENFRFSTKEGKGFEDFMRESKAKISLIEAHSKHFKVKLDLKDAKPQIYFSDEEIEEFSKKFEFLKDFAIIQPVGKTTYTPNKEWGFEKYQEVVNKTKDKINWVQVGLENEKLLENVIDLRGKTESLRELAFVIKKANFVLANEGLLNHLAAAVGTKSFVVFSGFHPVEIAKYDTTIAIVKNPQVECAPCWLLEKCPKERKWCTEGVLVEDVVEIITKELNI